jgi:hypothetical protein
MTIMCQVHMASNSYAAEGTAIHTAKHASAPMTHNKVALAPGSSRRALAHIMGDSTMMQRPIPKACDSVCRLRGISSFGPNTTPHAMYAAGGNTNMPRMTAPAMSMRGLRAKASSALVYVAYRNPYRTGMNTIHDNPPRGQIKHTALMVAAKSK